MSGIAGGGTGLSGVSLVDDAPDAAALAVAAGVVQRHLVVADDAVVEIGDVQGAVGAELDVHRPEPGVVAGEEIGLLDRRGRRAVPLEAVVVDAVGDRLPMNMVSRYSAGKWSAA